MGYIADIFALSPDHLWTFDSTYSKIVSATVSAGGAGYSIGDQLTLVGGTSEIVAIFSVTAETGGVVTGVTPLQVGAYSSQPSPPTSTTTNGGGINCTLTVTWSTPGNYIDYVGSADGTTTTFIVNTDGGLAVDTSECISSNGTTDIMSFPTTTDINGSQTQHAIAGWFSTSDIQFPHCRLYGEGDNNQCFQIVMGQGNNLIFEVDDPNFNVQIYGDTPLEKGRVYHLCMIFEGSGYANLLRAYIDGVSQLVGNPSNRQPGYTSLTARASAALGKSSSTVAIGGLTIVLVAAVKGTYSCWASWSGTNAALTDTEVKEELFEKGAFPAYVLESNTESIMQDVITTSYANITSWNVPLYLQVEAVSGGGDFTLVLTNLVFDDLCSIQIQYLGTDTLTIINSGTSNCDLTKTSTPNGGTIVVKQRTKVLVHVKDIDTGSGIFGARVYIEADTGGLLTAGTEIVNELTDPSGDVSIDFDFLSNQPIIGKVGKGSSTTYYKPGLIGGIITENGFTDTIYLIKDE